MQVILAEDIETLGRAGALVKVADGYARNYLLPKKLALLANPKNMKWVEHQKKVILEKAAQVRGTADEFAQRLSALQISIEKKAGDEGKLFGSVTAADIAEAIAAQGLEVDKRRIVISDPIKRVGEHTVTVKVHMDVAPQITVHVVAEGGEVPPETAAAVQEAPADDSASK